MHAISLKSNNSHVYSIVHLWYNIGEYLGKRYETSGITLLASDMKYVYT